MNIQDLRIAVLIPTRGDRKAFLDNCFRMLDRQTLQPTYINLINYAPKSDDKDITQRYRFGYNEISKSTHPFDLIFLCENDDYYSPTYLETMATEWLRAGQPDMMGTGQTIYYNLNLGEFFERGNSLMSEQYKHLWEPKRPCAYFTFNHPRRSSAMNMLLKPGLNLKWPEDNYAFTDLHLWNMSDVYQNFIQETARIPKNLWIKSHIFNPDKIISIGIKHGIGLCGGRNHFDRLERYDKPDFHMQFLRDNTDSESFEFYSTLFK